MIPVHEKTQTRQEDDGRPPAASKGMAHDLFRTSLTTFAFPMLSRFPFGGSTAPYPGWYACTGRGASLFHCLWPGRNVLDGFAGTCLCTDCEAARGVLTFPQNVKEIVEIPQAGAFFSLHANSGLAAAPRCGCGHTTRIVETVRKISLTLRFRLSLSLRSPNLSVGFCTP